MEEYIMYHKANCATSLATLKLLKQHGIKPTLRLYLEEVPTIAELNEVVTQLGGTVQSIIRKKEPLYKEQYEGKKLTKKQWLKVLADNPILIDRPILIKSNRAVLCRPIEKALELV